MRARVLMNSYVCTRYDLMINCILATVRSFDFVLVFSFHTHTHTCDGLSNVKQSGASACTCRHHTFVANYVYECVKWQWRRKRNRKVKLSASMSFVCVCARDFHFRQAWKDVWILHSKASQSGKSSECTRIARKPYESESDQQYTSYELIIHPIVCGVQ